MSLSVLEEEEQYPLFSPTLAGEKSSKEDDSISLSLLESEQPISKERPLLAAYREELRKSRMASQMLAIAPFMSDGNRLRSKNNVPKFVGSTSTKADMVSLSSS